MLLQGQRLSPQAPGGQQATVSPRLHLPRCWCSGGPVLLPSALYSQGRVRPLPAAFPGRLSVLGGPSESCKGRAGWAQIGPARQAWEPGTHAGLQPHPPRPQQLLLVVAPGACEASCRV